MAPGLSRSVSRGLGLTPTFQAVEAMNGNIRGQGRAKAGLKCTLTTANAHPTLPGRFPISPASSLSASGIWSYRRRKEVFAAVPRWRKCCRAEMQTQTQTSSLRDAAVGRPPYLSTPPTTIRSIQRQIARRERSAVEIVSDTMDKLEAAEPSLRSFLFFSREQALEQASAIDKDLLRALDGGEEEAKVFKSWPLAGVAVAVKDNLCTRDMPSTGGSKILHGYQPPYDATAVKKLRDAGAIVIGKTNMDEFGMGSSTESSGFHATSNPWDLERVPGGSSGGSAAAVAAHQCVAALGSDTGGSIRQPASFCGVVGFKPSYERVSRFGLMAYASSLDVVGCISSSVEDAAAIAGVIAGHDVADSTSSTKEVPDYASILPSAESLSGRPMEGVRLGLVKETLGKGVDEQVVAQVMQAAEHMVAMGAIISEVSLPTFSMGLPAYYILAASEASSNLARYDGVRYGLQVDGEDMAMAKLYAASRAQGFGDEVKRRILMGTYALSAGYYDAFYKRAQQVRTLIQRDFARALADNDALITPTAPSVAYLKGEKVSDPLAMYAGDMMTVNVNLGGLPAVSVPCGLAHGLPVGLQFISSAFHEMELLKIAHILELTYAGRNLQRQRNDESS